MTATDADYVLDGLSGEYRLGLREQVGRAFGGFWRSLFASSVLLTAVVVPVLYATTPWIVQVRESAWFGGAVNFGAFGVAAGYAYVCASTKYVLDADRVRIVRGWPFPSTSVSRGSIAAACVVAGMFCPLLRLELRDGRVRELVLSPTMMKAIERKREPHRRAAQQGDEADKA